MESNQSVSDEQQAALHHFFQNDKKKLLFVDDRSNRIHAALWKYGGKYDVFIAPSVKEALRLISTEVFDIISLDHDLNGDDFQDSEEPTSGMEIVRWIQRYGWPYLEKPRIIIHSGNAFAANLMSKALVNLRFNVKVVRFSYGGETGWENEPESES